MRTKTFESWSLIESVHLRFVTGHDQGRVVYIGYRSNANTASDFFKSWLEFTLKSHEFRGKITDPSKKTESQLSNPWPSSEVDSFIFNTFLIRNSETNNGELRNSDFGTFNRSINGQKNQGGGKIFRFALVQIIEVTVQRWRKNN